MDGRLPTTEKQTNKQKNMFNELKDRSMGITHNSRKSKCWKEQ